MRRTQLNLFLAVVTIITILVSLYLSPVISIQSSIGHDNGNNMNPDLNDYSRYYNANANSNAKKHILLSGIPMPGHVFPLLATAEVLAKRGYTVTVTTVKDLERFVKNQKHQDVQQKTIGDCHSVVEDWKRAQLDMNEIVDFATTSQMVFDWVRHFHPCHYAALHSELYRVQLGLDFDPRSPDYTIMPPIDFIVVDMVTQSLQDLARTLSIGYLLNNPDILQVIPGNVSGNWNNLPLLFYEQSIHPFNNGIEVRSYEQKFDPATAASGNGIINTNFTQVLNAMEGNDPYEFPKIMQENAQKMNQNAQNAQNGPKSLKISQNASNSPSDQVSYSAVLYHWYNLGTRMVYAVVRPMVEVLIWCTADILTTQHRHAQGEIFIFHHLQRYIHLLRNNKIPSHLINALSSDERDAIKGLLEEYKYDDVTFDELCRQRLTLEEIVAIYPKAKENFPSKKNNGDEKNAEKENETTSNNPLSIHDHNALLRKYIGSEFNIIQRGRVCRLYYHHKDDFDQSFEKMLELPQNPAFHSEFYSTFLFLFQLTPSPRPRDPSLQPIPLKWSFDFYSAPWLRYIFNYFGVKSKPSSPTLTAPFGKKSILQRLWSFYKSSASHWSSLSYAPGVPIIQGSIWGVEYQRPLPPLVHVVGPLIPESNSSTNIALKSTPSIERQLVWLDGTDDDDDDNNDDPVVYMSFGTLGHLTKDGTIALFQAYAQLITHTNLRFLWKLTTHYVEMVVDAYLESGVYIEGFFEAVEAIPRGASYLHQIQSKIALFHTQMSTRSKIPRNRWLFTEWVYSQVGVLEHVNTKIFVSHCGINSAYEAMVAKTYIFCIPLFGDQGHMATMLSDRDIGTALYKQHVTKDTLVAAMKFALAQQSLPRFTTAIARVKAHIDIAGGKEKAVDYIEFYMKYGSDHTVEPVSYNRAFFRADGVEIVNYRYTQLFDQGRVGYQDAVSLPIGNWWQNNDYDLYIIAFVAFNLVLILLWKILVCSLRCVTRLFCCCNGKHNRPEVDSNSIDVGYNNNLPQPQIAPPTNNGRKSNHRKND